MHWSGRETIQHLSHARNHSSSVGKNKIRGTPKATLKKMPILSINQLHEIYLQCGLNYSSSASSRHRGIFRGFMGSLYVKGKENGHVQAYAPIGAMVLKWRNSLTSKLDGYPVTSEPHLWRQACPWRKSLSRKIALTRIKFYGRKQVEPQSYYGA